jgi:tetratricopeptide (TPR) repeat protein
VVHEDDAERAVRAGLRVQGAVEELAGSAGLRARVAVGTGEAVVLLEGTTMDREGLVGDVVNTASRLQAEAPPGAVLVDEATQRATRRAIRYEERPPVVVKGKAEPLSVWVAVEPTARFGADVEDDGAPLVGRSAELALVIDAFGRAAGGSTQMVTIAGEPGVGKSRLVRELRRHIDDLPDLTRWRQGRCLPYGEGITWWALGDVAKAEAGVLETDTPATALGKLAASLEPVLADPEERAWVAGRLAPLVGSEADAASEAAERYAAWHRYLAALAEQRPTVVVIEDLHWADAALVEFLADVPDAARGTPLLLVCTARPDFFERFPAWGGGQRNALTVRLEPLDAEATRSLLDGLLAGEDLDDDTRRAVAERSGGNPLWAQEFVRMVHDRRDGTGDLAIPDTVQAVVASRIDLLESGPKTVLQAAALIGKSFWSGAVAAMLEEPIEVDDALHELARRELIRRERTSTFAGQTEYAFTHSVVRDVAAAGAPRAVRAIRHHRAARWIEAAAGDRVSDKTEMIAHHDADALRLAAATGMADVTRLVDHAVASHRRAAEYAAGLDVSAQRAHLEAALELVGAGDPRRGPLLYELGSAHGAAGATESGNKALFEARVALRDAGDMEGWGLATGVLSRFLWVSGEPDEAEALLDDAAEVLGEMPPGPALASVHAARAASRWLRGASAEALEMIEPIHHVVEVHGDSETRARLMSAEGGARFDAGDPSAIEPFRQVLRMAIEANNSMAIGTGHLNLGEQLRTGWGVAEAIPVHERGIELAVQRHIHGAEQFLRQSLALDYVLAGRWDDAIVQLDASEQIPDRFSYLEGAVIAERTRICAGRNGATERDAELIDEVVLEAEALKDLQAVIPAFDTAQFVHLMAGDEEAANRYARAIVERSGATRYAVDAWPFTVWILRSAGELERAAALLDGLRRFEMPRPRALLAATDALLLERSDPRAAAAELSRAAEELADLGNAVEAAVLFAEAHRIGRDAGDDAAASHAREAAVRLLEPSGARALAARLGVG